MDKSTVRRHLLDKRKRMTFKRRNAKSLKIINRLVKLLAGDKSVAIYLSLKDEVNMTDYLTYFLENFETVSASVVEDKQLVFYKVNNFRELKPGMMDILEPSKNEKVDKNTIDTIIVPLVGFDQQNNRIGYGKGFYDKYLSDYQGKTIGVGFDQQEYPHIPHNELDVSLDYIVTETRTFKK